MDLNPYEELGVSHNASEAHIRSAYRAQAKIHHPDVGGDRAEWDRMSTALAVLIDPKKRKTYDDTGRIEEDKPDNDRASALQVIEALMAEIMNAFISSGFDPFKDPRRMDVIADIKKKIMGDIKQARDGAATGENVVVFMRDMMKRFKLKKRVARTADDDPIVRGLDRQIKSTEQQLDGIRASLRVRELALEIVDGYRFQREESFDVDAYHRGQPSAYSWSA